MNILFFDPDYTGGSADTQALRDRAVGGSESSMVLLADALARNHHVTVVQRRRDNPANYGGADYAPLEYLDAVSQATVDVVVVIRAIKEVTPMRARFPRAAMILWVHDFLPGKRRKYAKALRAAQCSVVAVSHTHAGHTAAVLGNGFLRGYDQKNRTEPANWPVTAIYNPLPDHCTPDDTPVDRDKLVFFSSPHKGLQQVRALFAEAHRRNPALKLYLANPGYRALDSLSPKPGVEVLGALSRDEVITHVRSALCVFYPQTLYPETFGLVYAESNAVGTPVLAHDFGAAPEILTPEQLVDGDSAASVIDTLLRWRDGDRPDLRRRSDFDTAVIVSRWERILRRLVDSVDALR